MVYDWSLIVRIYVCISVARVVFSAGVNTVILHSLHIGGGKVCHNLWISAEGTLAVCLVVRVRADICNRSKVNVYVQVFQLFSNVLPHLVEKLFRVIFYSCKQCLTRISRILRKTHIGTPLGICHLQKRNGAYRLQIVNSLNKLSNRTSHNDYASNSVLSYQRILEGFGFLRWVAAYGNDKELCNLLLYREFTHQFIYLFLMSYICLALRKKCYWR